jgi:peptidoglycan/LPS O-acetylase OafA/YrhL
MFLVIDFMLFRKRISIQDKQKYLRIFRGYVFKTISIVGVCSYSIYLIHQIITSRMIKSVNFFWLGNTYQNFKLLDGIIIFVIILLISYSFYLWVELKSIALGKKINNLFFTKNSKINY